MLSLADIPKRKLFRLKLRVIAIAVGVIAALVMSILVQEEYYYWAFVPVAFIILASLAEFVIADILTEKIYPARTEDLLEKLESRFREYHDRTRETISKTIGAMRACDKSRISGVFHLVVDLYPSISIGDKPERALVQVTNYSGDLGGKRWRFTLATKGLIGRCLRTGRAECVNFSTVEEYRERMVSEFGFLPDEVALHTQEARSYWAEPVFVRDQMVGVIFFFSTEIQVFPLAIEETLMKSSAREIAAFLEGSSII